MFEGAAVPSFFFRRRKGSHGCGLVVLLLFCSGHRLRRGVRRRIEGALNMMNLRSVLILFAAALAAADQAAAFTAPADKVSAAVAEGITQTLMRRGFGQFDPRVTQTLAAISGRTVTTAAAAGTGATWAATVARLSPWVMTGVAVYSGVTWYFDNQGKAYLAPPGSVSSTPVFSNGTVLGQLVWTASTGYFGSPQEALAYMFSQSKIQYPDAVYGVPVLTQNSATQYTAQYNYSIPSIYLNNMSGTKTVTAVTWNGMVCPAGSGYVSGSTCTSAGLAQSPWAGAPVVGYDIPTAYSNLPAAAKAAPLKQELAAETANRLWADASAQPGYQGVPWSSTTPTVAADFAPYATGYSTYWPSTSDWGTGAVPTTNAVSSPESNPNATATAPTGATKIDLGTDPGTPPPTLSDPPSDLFKPISDLLQPWLSWQVPSHSSACPTWQASPSIAGRVFNIDLSYHCTFAEQYRSAIFAAAMTCWILIAAFIILSA